MKSINYVLAGILFIFLSVQTYAQVIYVNAGASGNNDGTSWTDAYTDLQTALSNATPGDTVWVAAGIYKPTTGNDRRACFSLRRHVYLFGGFSGNESSLQQRNYAKNNTILSGDIGATGAASDNVYHVVYGNDSTCMDGFTIQDGYADYDANGVDHIGGGFDFDEGDGDVDLTIKNCVFQNNYAKQNGGAMFINNANMVIENCIFKSNRSGYSTNAYGGAVTVASSDVVFRNCVFTDNHADYGAAVFNGSKDRSQNFINCTFYKNVPLNSHGEVADEDQVSKFTNCIFGYWMNPFYNIDDPTFSFVKPIVNYSCFKEDVSDTYTGTGNIIADPLFVSDTVLQLQYNSPCIDAANGDSITRPDYAGSPTFDNPWVANSGIGTPNFGDMGAYEFYTDKLIGTYTIGSSGDFHSFSEAVTSLINKGVGGPVVFNVQSGTYNEQVNLPGVEGQSAQNTITFQSVTGDSTDVVLTYASTDANNNYTLKLDSAKYVSFKNMTFEATGSTYARVVYLNNGASFNNFSNCQFIGVPNVSELVYCNNDISWKFDTVNVFSNNKFINGAIGFQLNTYSYGNEHTITLTNNEFLNQSNKAIYIQSALHSKIISNYIHSNLYCTGIMIENRSNGDTISNNIIQLNAGGTGLYMYCFQSANDTTLISNNFIYLNTTNADKGINLYQASTFIKMYYNTIHITGNNTGSLAFYSKISGIYVLNNIFANEANGQAAYFQSGVDRSDYNNFYYNGEYQDFNNLEWWQQHENHDIHSISVNPYFTADTSYHVQYYLLDGAGTPLDAVTTDIEGDQRDVTNPCIGADEFTPSLSPMHGVYTIGGSSPDFVSINNAVDSLVIRGVDGAVTFNIAPGTYNEQITIPDIQGASATNNITFQSATGDSSDVIITYTAQNEYNNSTVCLDGAKYFTLKSLTITADTAIGNPVRMYSGACFNTLSNDIIKTNWFSKPLVQIGTTESFYNYLDSNLVIKNSYFENGKYAVRAGHYSNVTVTKNVLVQNNYFMNCGLDLYNSIEHTVIVKSNTFNINNVAVDYLTAISSADTITNNMIYMRDPLGNNNYKGVFARRGGFIAYNTVKILGGGYALYCYGEVNVYNNVLFSDGRTVFYNDTTNCKIDYNVYYSTSSSYYIKRGNNYYTLTQWQQNTNFDAHSLYYNPVFVSDTNLHTNDSWLNNRGVAIAGVTTDIDGQTRSTTTPDIGADEFNGHSPLSGIYTIGATGDFPDFTNAVDSMNAFGVEDSVIFNVQAGTYNEQIYLADSNITRIPDTAAIVFQSLSGDSTDVILQNNNTANNYVIYLDSIDYVNINHITIKALDENNAVVLRTRSSSNNIISNNILQGNGNVSPVILSANGLDNNNTISHNIINDGKYGIVFIGESTQGEENNIFEANILENQYSGGIQVKYQHLQQILHNKITRSDPVEDTVWIGIGVFNCSGNWNKHILVANNMISFNATGKSAGIHLYEDSYINIYFNSVNVFGDNAKESRDFNIESSGGDVKNNIFYNTAKGLVYYNVPATDYNDVYTNGDNFAYNNGFIPDYASWVRTTGQDQNSLSIDPMFVSDIDLHISQAQLVGKGTYIKDIYTDFDGDIRDTLHPTIGADRISLNCNGPLSGNYTVGDGGDFQDFNDLLLTMSVCGIDGNVTFNILQGTYNEQVKIYYIKDKTDNDTITFQSQTGDPADVIIQFDADSANNYVFEIQNQKNFYIKNITLQSLDTTYGRVLVLNDTILNLNLTGNIINGVVSNSQDDNTACVYYKPGSTIDTCNIKLQNNTVNNGSYGFRMISGQIKLWLNITSNIFNNQKNTAVKVYVIATTENNNIFDFIDNEINSNRDLSVGLYFGYSGGACNVSFNKVTLSSGTAFEVYAYPTAFISNNFVSTHGRAFYSTWNAKIYNNTFYCFGSDCIQSDVYSSSSKVYIKNNCLVSTGNGYVISNYGNHYSQLFEMDYNNIYSTRDYEDIINTLGQNTHSVSFIPDFVSNTDLHTNSALLYQKGISIPEITVDIDGEPRNDPPCIGADEFTTPVFNGKDTVFCYYVDKYDGVESYTYDIGYGYDSYLWSTGSDSSSILIDPANTSAGDHEYTVTVTTGGKSYSDTIHIQYDLPVAIDQTEFCRWNAPLTITANPGYVYYDWGMGDDTSQSITKDCTGCSFPLNVTDEHGCISKRETLSIHGTTDSYPANMNLQDTVKLCTDNTMEIVGNQYTGSDLYSKYHYLWSNGDTTRSIVLDGSTFTPAPYVYAVSVYLMSDTLCVSYDTVIVNVDMCNGIWNTPDGRITIYPNPSAGRIFVTFNEPVQDARISVYNTRGGMVWQSGKTGPVSSQKEIDLSGIPAGVYIISVRVENRIYQQKLIIK